MSPLRTKNLLGALSFSSLTFPTWCSILELVRTPVVKQSLLRGTAHFVPTAVADEEVSPPAWPKPLRRGEGPRKFKNAAARTERSRSEPHRSKPAKSPEKQSARTMF